MKNILFALLSCLVFAAAVARTAPLQNDQPVQKQEDKKSSGKGEKPEIQAIEKQLPLPSRDMLPPSLPVKKLPVDTMQKFLDNFGRDSLLTIIDAKIAQAKSRLLLDYMNITDELSKMTLNLVSRQFKLGLDSIKLTYGWEDSLFVRLYGRNYSIAWDLNDTVTTKKIPSADLYNDFTQKLDNRYTLVGVGALGHYLNLPDKLFRTMYEHYRTKPVNSRIDLFYTLAEYARNNPGKAGQVSALKDSVFLPLYDTYNLSKTVDALVANGDQETGAIFSYVHPLKILALGYYDHQVGLKLSGRDLMYLLSIQSFDGGWPQKLKWNNVQPSDPEATVYALWALCEFREEVKALKK